MPGLFAPQRLAAAGPDEGRDGNDAPAERGASPRVAAAAAAQHDDDNGGPRRRDDDDDGGGGGAAATATMMLLTDLAFFTDASGVGALPSLPRSGRLLQVTD